MNLKLAVNEKDNMKGTIRLLKFVVSVIGIALIWMAFKVGRAVEYQKTILVPYGLDTKMVVTGDDISEEGIEFYAQRITSLRFTYSPGTARKYFTLLLRMYSPEAYPDAWKALYDLADKIETANVTSVFYLDKLTVDKKNKQIIAEGSNRKYKDNTPLDSGGVHCIISYKVHQGMFQILKIEEREKK
jgi:conjugal transfer pilus assembly protein TraE